MKIVTVIAVWLLLSGAMYPLVCWTVNNEKVTAKQKNRFFAASLVILFLSAATIL